MAMEEDEITVVCGDVVCSDREINGKVLSECLWVFVMLFCMG